MKFNINRQKLWQFNTKKPGPCPEVEIRGQEIELEGNLVFLGSEVDLNKEADAENEECQWQEMSSSGKVFKRSAVRSLVLVDD